MTGVLEHDEQLIYDVLYVENKTYELASMRLNLPPGTLNRKVADIRRKLRAAGQPLPDKRRHFVTH